MNINESMRKSIVVFDMDDVMWNLNKHVAEIKGIPYEKFTQFSIYDNPNMTEEEKQKVLAAYTEAATYTDIEFTQPVVDLINDVHRLFPQYYVHIISNSATEAVRDVKLPQLLRVLDLPKERLHLKVIDMPTQSCQKKLPDNMFLFVDDSIHNQEMANAVHKIMPARLHNEGTLLKGRFLATGERVDRPETPEALRNLVFKYLQLGS